MVKTVYHQRQHINLSPDAIKKTITPPLRSVVEFGGKILMNGGNEQQPVSMTVIGKGM
jgi:hypothetical protein